MTWSGCGRSSFLIDSYQFDRGVLIEMPFQSSPASILGRSPSGASAVQQSEVGMRWLPASKVVTPEAGELPPLEAATKKGE
jgi:hypothetical protein